MSHKGRGKTAAEFLAERERDPVAKQRQEANERAHLERVREHKMALAPLIEELVAASWNVSSLDELRMSGKPYPGAIPILVRWLHRAETDGMKDDIVRTLTFPWARAGASAALVAEFRQAAPMLRWTIGNALGTMADDSMFEELAAFATATEYGQAREMIVVGLGKMKDPRVFDVLVRLLDDDGIVGHAVMALGKLGRRAAGARDRIDALTEHPKAWVRREAKKALKRIDR